MRWLCPFVAAGAILSHIFPGNFALPDDAGLPAWQQEIEAARAEFRQTRYVDALARFQKSYEAAEKAGLSAELRGQLLISIGGCLLGLSDYKGALARFLEARPHTVTGGNAEHLAALEANIASVYLYQGDRENAARFYRRALERLRGKPASPHRPLILANLGLVELQEGSYRRALELEEAALGSLPPSENAERRAQVEDLHGCALLGLRDYDGARRSFERSLELRRAAAEGGDRTRSLMFLGRTELERGRPGPAAEWLEQAVASAAQRDNRVALWAALYLRARASRALGRPGRAIDDLRRAVEILESIWPGLVPTDALRVQFEVSHHEVYAALAELLCERGAAAEAFQVVESGRSRSLRALVAGRSGSTDARQPSLWTRYRDRLARLEAARSHVVAGGPDAKAWRIRAAEQEAALRDLESRMRVEDPVLSQAVFAPAFELAAVQSRLDSESVLLSFHAAQAATYLWAVTRSRWEFFRLAPPAEWAPIVRRFLPSARDAAADHRPLGRRLYELLLGKTDRLLLSKAHWIVAAEGDLALLPFEALTAPSGRYVIEERAVSYTPSASVLAMVQSRETPRYRAEFLAVADPIVNRADPRGAAACPAGAVCEPLPRLVSTAAEVRACARLFGPDRATILTGPDATEDRLLRAAARPHRFWHFASHVIPDPERPLHSFIALTLPDRLTAYDVAGLPVRAEMVVLNGCESGAGKALPGAGILGLARAFLAAGAVSVCATRWRIPDEAGALVERLYAHVLRGAGRAEALRQAQMEMIRAGGWRGQPRYWAAYFLTGDGGPIAR